MRTITLELLRHGPAHNQLLSPITAYLALCENHGAVTLNVPFEHNQMLHRLRALSYRTGDESRVFQVQDTARAMGELLAQVPGLTADMNRQDEGEDEDADPITHVRLVLSASELALLPFELAVSPPGLPGAGQNMLLQAQAPVCLTRETRRVTEDFGEWPKAPRVLVVVASPLGLPPVPAAAHLLAMRQALAPWVGRCDADAESTEGGTALRAEQFLTLLVNASIEDIEEACARNHFTHVHVLAHGLERRSGNDLRFGVALHKRGGAASEIDIVSGERLASALRVSDRQAGHASRPIVVTLASCNSGNVGDVVGIGASVAHALHEAGIPLVIASQFPLSYGASVRFVEVLYQGFLWGEDPRGVLVELRRRLHTEFANTHDWASITAYSSLPGNFQARLADVQISRTMSSLDVALGFADTVAGRVWADKAVARAHRVAPATSKTAGKTAGKSKARSQAADAGPAQGAARTHHMGEAHHQRHRQAKEGVKAATDRLTVLLERYPRQAARIYSCLASIQKRIAVLDLQMSEGHEAGSAAWAQARDEGLQALHRSRERYWKAYTSGRDAYWSALSYISMTLLLKAAGQLPGPDQPGQDVAALWQLVEVQARHDAYNGKERERAICNLIECYVLAPLVEGLPDAYGGQYLQALVVERAAELAGLGGRQGVSVVSARRKLMRLIDLYDSLAESPRSDEVFGLAQQALALLPGRDVCAEGGQR